MFAQDRCRLAARIKFGDSVQVIMSIDKLFGLATTSQGYRRRLVHAPGLHITAKRQVSKTKESVWLESGGAASGAEGSGPSRESRPSHHRSVTRRPRIQAQPTEFRRRRRLAASAAKPSATLPKPRLPPPPPPHYSRAGVAGAVPQRRSTPLLLPPNRPPRSFRPSGSD